MKKILFPVLLTTAFLTACHEDGPTPAEHKTVISSIHTVGKYETLDSLEYNNKGQLVKHLVFDVEDEELTLNSYSVYTYSSGSIEKKSYSAAGAVVGQVTFTLDGKGFIASNGTVAFTYDNDRLSKAGNLTLTYQNGDLVSDSAGYTYTPSDVANPGWWPIDIDNVDAPLYWMGLYGNRPNNLVEKWSATIDGVSHTGSCDYELEAGRLVNVTKSVIVKTGNTPSISDYYITINWMDL